MLFVSIVLYRYNLSNVIEGKESSTLINFCEFLNVLNFDNVSIGIR